MRMNNADGKRTDSDTVRLVATLADGTFIVEHTDGRLERQENRTDWARVDALTDAEIEDGVRDDPDAVPLDFNWAEAEVIVPPKKKAISIRVDEDVLDFFKSGGSGYQRRMNAVLRSYMQDRKKRG